MSIRGDLGDYIVSMNPYQAVLPPKNTWSTVPPPPVVTIANAGNADERFSLALDGPEAQEQPGTWKFKYGDHYVQRALRIPYMFYRESDNDPTKGVLVRDYFLVGFEGGGAY